ncbi:3',5'-cyclic nucleotide phosphodiesterase, putative [Hepatocystis sp. ex Piliocolobus tephrosceles]|nr:3',5'-cyclic nucleotide phosphodiesterase, putative [Hepatocystis sp. ex Piliocolobus tephrosceles]
MSDSEKPNSEKPDIEKQNRKEQNRKEQNNEEPNNEEPNNENQNNEKSKSSNKNMNCEGQNYPNEINTINYLLDNNITSSTIDKKNIIISKKNFFTNILTRNNKKKEIDDKNINYMNKRKSKLKKIDINDNICNIFSSNCISVKNSIFGSVICNSDVSNKEILENDIHHSNSTNHVSFEHSNVINKKKSVHSTSKKKCMSNNERGLLYNRNVLSNKRSFTNYINYNKKLYNKSYYVTKHNSFSYGIMGNINKKSNFYRNFRYYRYPITKIKTLTNYNNSIDYNRSDHNRSDHNRSDHNSSDHNSNENNNFNSNETKITKKESYRNKMPKKKSRRSIEFNKFLESINEKKLQDVNVDYIKNEEDSNMLFKSKSFIRSIKNKNDNLYNLNKNITKDKKLLQRYGQYYSIYDNNNMKKFGNLSKYFSDNRNRMSNVSSCFNLKEHKNEFIIINLDKIRDSHNIILTASKSDGNIQMLTNNKNASESKHYNNYNIKLKTDNFLATGKKKSIKSKFINVLFKIWKRSLQLKNEFAHFNNNSGFNIFKNHFSDNYLNHSNINDLIHKIPLKFKDKTVEKLYVLNLNHWIVSKIICIGLVMFILCFLIWLLLSWSFKWTIYDHTNNFNLLSFHIIMIINIICFLFFIVIGCTKLGKHAEIISFFLFAVMIILWGLWNIKYSLTSEIIPSTRIFALSPSVQTIDTIIYMYGLSLIVIMDILFSLRTKYNWIIHMLFIVLNSVSILIVGYRHPETVSLVFSISSVIIYITLCLLLYIGCYKMELQLRHTFYNLLIMAYKVDIAKSDIYKNNKKKKKKFSTAIEDLILMIKVCTQVILELEKENDVNFNIQSKASYCVNILEDCLSTLTKNDNLYNVDYDVFDKLENKKFIEAYVSKNGNNLSKDCDDSVDYKHKTSLCYHDYNNICAADKSKKKIKKFLNDINVPDLIKNIRLINKKVLLEWDFNCLNYFKKSKYAFFDINMSLMSMVDNEIPKNTVINFLSLVQKQYNNVPYHNIMHAAMVTQKFFCLSKKLGIYDFMENKIKFVMFISGICHDIGHPGYNNLFFVNSLHPLSIIYNDISILENYHASITFKILQLNECNLLKSFSENDFRLLRTYIIELILGTDMKYHFEIISKFRIRRENDNFDYIKNGDDLLMVIKMLLKSADISHGSVKWDEHYKWCQRVLCEFYLQGDEEIKNKMPLSPLCDRTKHNEVGQSQFTFLKFVVMPLFEELTYIDNNKFVKSLCLKRLNANCNMWNKLMKNEKEIEVYDNGNVKTEENQPMTAKNKKKSYIDLTFFYIKNICE